MKQLKPIVQVPLRFGIYGGLLSGIIMVILFYIDRHPFLISPMYDFRIILFAVFIFFSVKEFRDFYQAGELYFWQAMAIGILCYLVTGLMGALIILLFSNIEPMFVTDYIDLAMQQLLADKEAMINAVGEEAYENALNRLPETSSMAMAGDYLIKSMIIGFFLTIIISVVLRRQPKTI
jgi:hypothetical protein